MTCQVRIGAGGTGQPDELVVAKVDPANYIAAAYAIAARQYERMRILVDFQTVEQKAVGAHRSQPVPTRLKSIPDQPNPEQPGGAARSVLSGGPDDYAQPGVGQMPSHTSRRRRRLSRCGPAG